MPGVNIKVKFNAEGADSAEKATKNVGDALDKVTDSAGGMAASVESAWAALKSRATADIAAEMKRVVEAFRDIKTAGTSSAQDVSRAYDTMRERLRGLSAEVKQFGQANKDALAGAWSSLGSRSTSAIAAEMKGVVEAFRTVKTAGTSSAQDVTRAYTTMRERLNGLSAEAKGAAKEIGGTSDAALALEASARSSGISLRSMGLGIIALAGAYQALQAASAFVSRTFDFSSNIEDSQIAIASVLGATNKIADSQGRMLEGAEKFSAAQQISAQMMEKIQVLALQTTANFDDIVQGVSGIIAPATKAGVAMEKLPQFAVTAAQAMTAMKIPVQQMRTEIESLLSGNITRSQDLLATNLGITGEMVRNWQQQGTLVEELNKRISIFNEAGAASAQTWSGLTSNMKEALDYLSTQTGKGLFESAKQSYRELYALLVSTDQNKLGLNEDVKNLVEMMRELEDEIGNKLVEATKDFVATIKELNKPENTEELKQSLKSIGNLLSDVGSAISSISGMAFGVVRDLNSEFQSLPEDLRTFGLIGLMLFGKTGPAKMLAAVAAAYVEAPKVGSSIAAQIAGMFGQDVAVSSDGADATKLYWQRKNGNVPQKALPIPLARSGTPMSFVGPPKPDQTYTLTNAIGGFDNKKSGGADKIANAREQIQKLREEIDALNGDATKKSNSLDQKEREIAKLGKTAGLSAAEVAQLQDDYAEAFKTNTLKEFNKHLMEVEGNTKALRDIKIDEEMTKWQSSFNELVARGKMSSEEATESLTRMKTALVNQSEVKDLQTAVQFYKELGELSGQYGAGIEFQNRLLKEQARAWKQAGIPDELVAEMVKLKQLQDSVNGFDGAYRGLLKFTAEYSNEAKQWENITYSWATGFNDTTKDMWGDFLDTGKVSFDQLSLSFTKLLKDMSYQALVQPIVLSIVGMARDSIYSATSAGQSGGGSSGSSSLYGAAGSLAQQYGMSQLMNGAGVMTGITSTVNGWGASMFPSVFAENAAVNAALNNATLQSTWLPGTLPTSTLLGTLGAAGMGYGIGSIGGTLLASLTGGNSAAMSTGGGIGGGLGAGIGSIIAPGIGTFIGGALGSLLGSGAGGLFSGGLFGGGGSEPGLWLDTNVDLLGEKSTETIQSIVGPNKGRGGFADAGGNGYYIQTRARNGTDYSAATSSAQYLEQVAKQALALSSSVKSTMSSISSDLGTGYVNALRPNAWLYTSADGEGDDTPNAEQVGKQLMAGAYSRITDAVAHTDLSKLAIAADGMASDTMAELSQSITKAASVANISTSMGDYADKYLAAVSTPLLNALNTMDTSKLALTIDKSSLAGWSAAATAIQAMDGVKTSISGILTPASELTAAMTTANTQMDTWIASLKQLGWQESAIAEVEAKRLAYLEQYENALTRSAEQNLYLRGLALSAGTDSWTYQSQSLKYQQENELADYAKKYGSEAELLAAKAAKLNADAYQGKSDWNSNDVYEGIKAAGMTVAQWLERYGRSEGFKQNIALYDQLMYTQQAESIKTELNYWQKQYDSMMKAQIAAEQEKASSDYAAFRDKISDEQNRLQEQYRAEQELMQDQISSTRDAIGSLEDLVDSFENASEKLDDARHDLWGGTNNLSTSRMSDVRANWSEVYAKAMAGDTDAMSELPSISTNLLNLGKEQIASRDVYQDLFYEVDRKLKDAQGIAKSQYSVNKSQYDTQKSLLASQEAALDAQKVQYDAQNAKLTEQLSAQQAAYNTQIAQLNAQSAQLNAQNTSNYTLSDISSKISSLTAQLATATAQVGSTTATQNETLLQSKANQLNMIGYMGRTDWTAQSVQSGILDAGMTVDQWYQRHGINEGVSSSYTSTSSGKSDAELLAEKAASLNASGYGGKSDWTASSVAKGMSDLGMTVSQWYDRHGKAEGFATGGITPANQPFWVGENGPELVVSPQQWGVINNTDSMALMRGMSGGGNINSGAIVAAINNMNDTLRQLLTKTDRIMADQGRIRDRMDMFAQEGVTIAAA